MPTFLTQDIICKQIMVENFPSVIKRLFSFLFHVAKKLLFEIKKELNSPSPLLRQLICNEGIHLRSAFWQLLISSNRVAIRN